jgi:outer membrane cobalamin receptor
MLRHRQIITAIAAYAAIACLSWADDGPEPVSGLISVTATRIPESPSSVPPAVTVVTSDEIEARGAKTAADAIKIVPGVTVSDNGPLGAQQAVSIRGSTANQVLILVDGVRANNAMSGLADLSNIPAENIDHIEVLRGGGSALYGGDAVGGIVLIVTKKKAGPFILSFENGGYLPSAHVIGFGFNKADEPAAAQSLVDSQKAAFSWSPLLGGVLMRSSGSITRAANGYTFLDGNGDTRELQNAALLGGDASLGLTLPCWEGNLDADLAGGYSTKGIPGSQTSPTLDTTETDSSGRASLRYVSDRFLSDAFDIDARLHAEYSGIDYVDTDAPANDGDHKVFVGGLDLQQRWLVSPAFSWVYGTQTSYSQALSDTVGSPWRIAAGAFLEPIIEVGSLSLRPALRYDYCSDFFAASPTGGIGATLGAAYRLSDTDTLKLNLSRTYRVPTFEDLYWPAANGCAGNPDLKPETAYAADLGFSRSDGSLTYNAIIHARYAKDVILWQAGSDGIWRPSNYGAVLYPGVEQEFRTSFSGQFWTAINYSFLYTYLLDVGMTLASDLRVPMVPVHSLNAVLGYDTDKWSWSVTARYASLRYLTTGNVGYLPSYLTLDAIIKWKASTRYVVYIAADNLFDEQYETVKSYPMPGTEIRLGIEMRF